MPDIMKVAAGDAAQLHFSMGATAAGKAFGPDFL
jgi:hypothetical protein